MKIKQVESKIEYDLDRNSSISLDYFEDKLDQNKKKEYIIDFSSLKEQNPDTVAYIQANNMNIDYIVVKGENNQYYLNHNFEKKCNVAGWIFGDYHNLFDGTDRNIII